MTSSQNFPDEAVVAQIAKHPNGLGIEALEATLGGALQRRTLQRQLARLIERGTVLREGAARAARYRLRPVEAQAVLSEAGDDERAAAQAYIPTSPEGAEVKALVRRPVHERKPVGYQAEFLYAYEPNRSAYLPPALREQLHQIGRIPAASDAPAGTFARNILARLLIDLSWASSRLEGNTYSLLDTQRLVEQGQAADGKDAIETQMILNHKAAIEYLVQGRRIAVNRSTVFALHALLSDGLLPDSRGGGRLRTHAVDIGGSVFLPVALPQQLATLFTEVMRRAAAIEDPFEQAFFLMVHLPYLQPFEDVNKRVSRLAANIPLVRSNLSPLSFIDVPTAAYVDGILGVYELQRVDLLREVFVFGYERSCQRYAAVRQQLVPPDRFRLRYREALGLAMQSIVRGAAKPPWKAGKAGIAAHLPSAVASADRKPFIELVERELAALHEGNAIRFGLRPLELQAWQESQAAALARKKRR